MTNNRYNAPEYKDFTDVVHKITVPARDAAEAHSSICRICRTEKLKEPRANQVLENGNFQKWLHRAGTVKDVKK